MGRNFKIVVCQNNHIFVSLENFKNSPEKNSSYAICSISSKFGLVMINCFGERLSKKIICDNQNDTCGKQLHKLIFMIYLWF